MKTKTKTPKKPEVTEQRCAAQHFGPWMVYPQWFSQAVQSVKAGTFKPKRIKAAEGEGFQRGPGGIAVIPIFGQVTKSASGFGGASTVRARQAIRKAANDDSVSAILLHIDSPGGTVAGTGDLASDVAEINKSKRVYTYFEDLGASAAYWIGSQASRIFANPTAEIGSIGTMTYVEDTSGAYEKAGIKVTLIATGKYKGQWIDGNPVSEDYIQAVRTEIEDLNEHFLQGVMNGRRMSRENLSEIADGRIFIASKAKELGLIDEVASFDAAMQAILSEVTRMTAEQFSAYAAENPEAAEVKSLLAKGHKLGKAEGLAEAKTTLKSIATACPGRAEFAIEQFVAGADSESVKATVSILDREAAANKARAEESAKQVADMQKQIDQLKAQVGTQGAIGTAGSAAKDDESDDAANAPKPENPDDVKAWAKAKAGAEWKAKAAGTESFRNEAGYVAVRTAQLSGVLKTVERKQQ